MKPIDYLELAVRRWDDFQGRSRRAEYWWFFLAIVIAGLLATMLDGLLFGNWRTGALQVLVGLASLVIGISLSVRRLHDIGRSGWWLLIGFIPFGGLVLLYLHAKRGTAGANRFGPDPLAVAPAAAPTVG